MRPGTCALAHRPANSKAFRCRTEQATQPNQPIRQRRMSQRLERCHPLPARVAQRQLRVHESLAMVLQSAAARALAGDKQQWLKLSQPPEAAAEAVAARSCSSGGCSSAAARGRRCREAHRYATESC